MLNGCPMFEDAGRLHGRKKIYKTYRNRSDAEVVMDVQSGLKY